jgi:hypothetical protein
MCTGQFHLPLFKLEGREFLEPSRPAQACTGIPLIMQGNGDKGSGGAVPRFLNSHTLQWVTCFTSDHITTKKRTKGTLWIGGWAVPRASVATAAKIKTATPFGNQIPLLCCPGTMPNQYKHLTKYWIILKIVNQSLKFDTTIWTTGWCFTVLRYASLRTTRKCVLSNSTDVFPIFDCRAHNVYVRTVHIPSLDLVMRLHLP